VELLACKTIPVGMAVRFLWNEFFGIPAKATLHLSAYAYVTLLVWIWSLRGAHCKRGKLTECGLNLFNYSDMSYLCGIIP
jgi:hypothetical protein